MKFVRNLRSHPPAWLYGPELCCGRVSFVVNWANLLRKYASNSVRNSIRFQPAVTHHLCEDWAPNYTRDYLYLFVCMSVSLSGVKLRVDVFNFLIGIKTHFLARLSRIKKLKVYGWERQVNGTILEKSIYWIVCLGLCVRFNDFDIWRKRKQTQYGLKKEYAIQFQRTRSQKSLGN